MATPAPTPALAGSPTMPFVLRDDPHRASQDLEKIIASGLLAQEVNTRLLILHDADRLDPVVSTSTDDLKTALKRIDFGRDNTSEVLVLTQKKNARGKLLCSRDGLEAIVATCQPYNSLILALEAFVFDDGNQNLYLGRAMCATDIRESLGGGPAYQTCSLLTHIERNGRATKGSNAWSIRNMAWYQKAIPKNRHETVLLVSPSHEVERRLTECHVNPSYRPFDHWTRFPTVLVLASTANWDTYTATLHQEVGKLTSDASFTDPHQSRKGEADVKSLKECMALADTLQYACHALESNIDVLLVLQVEAIKRKKLDLATQAPEYEAFFQTLENVLRQLQVYKKHVVLLSTRLERTTAMVRDLVSLRNTHTIEEMTIRTIAEGKAVKLIAVVTLLFLPPSFTTAFLQANLVDVSMSSGQPAGLSLRGEPGLLFWIAITAPLMVLTLGGWVLWQWRLSRRVPKEWKSLA